MFKDRVDAGNQLGDLLERYAEFDPVVLGLCRGGMVVAREVAEALGAELDVLVVREVRAPGFPGLTFGAVAADTVHLHTQVAAMLGIRQDRLCRVLDAEQHEMRRREKLYRHGGSPSSMRGRVVILVDDGRATGSTATAAVRAARSLGASRVIFASPVWADRNADALLSEADNVICVLAPRDFKFASDYYEEFEQVTDAEAQALLAAYRSVESCDLVA
jgi:predicted phosphoribosyltransferase